MEQDNIEKRKRGRPKGSKNNFKNLTKVSPLSDGMCLLYIWRLIYTLKLAALEKKEVNENKSSFSYSLHLLNIKELRFFILFYSWIIDLHNEIEDANRVKEQIKQYTLTSPYVNKTIQSSITNLNNKIEEDKKKIEQLEPFLPNNYFYKHN